VYPLFFADIVDADPAASSSFLDDVTSQLDHSDEDDDLFSEASPSDAFVAHLYPTDCPNIMMSMKTLITGFVERHNKGAHVSSLHAVVISKLNELQ